ncbi:MAG: hypothetical protein ABWY20_10505, partial [Mycobacterium sp.]
GVLDQGAAEAVIGVIEVHTMFGDQHGQPGGRLRLAAYRGQRARRELQPVVGDLPGRRLDAVRAKDDAG